MTTCEFIVHPRRSVGVLGKGRESFRPGFPYLCGKPATDGFCPRHAAVVAKVQKANAERRGAR